MRRMIKNALIFILLVALVLLGLYARTTHETTHPGAPAPTLVPETVNPVDTQRTMASMGVRGLQSDTESSLGEEAGQTYNELKSKAQENYQELQQQTQETSAQFQKTAAETLETLSEQATKITETVSQSIETFKATLQREMDKFNQTLQKQNASSQS